MKFIYLADTHIGGSDVQGYYQQQRSLRYADELFQLLSEWLNQHPEVLFLIHGGDLVDDGSPENILLARDLFATLPIPCYLSLGNHDLTCANSLSQWLQLAPEFFPQKQADYSLMREDVRLDFLCAQWGSKPYLWDPSEEQIPTFTDKQLALLRNGWEGKRRILITHAPPCGLPAAQTGLQNPLHPPAGNFQTVLENLAKELKLDLILGAHNHMNLAVKSNPAFFVTTSAFTETPFEFKLFEITKDILSMCTLNLLKQLPFRSHYDHQKGYVQGRPCDRGFHEKRQLSEPPR